MEHSQSGKDIRRTGMQRLQLIEVVLTVLGLFFFGNYASNIYSANQKKHETKIYSSPTPASVTNTQDTKTSSPGIKVNTQVKKVVQPSPSPASDYVKCNVSAECGGGTRSMTKTACSASTCCQVGDKWLFMASSEECKKAQDALLMDCIIDGKIYRVTPGDCAKLAPSANGFSNPNPIVVYPQNTPTSTNPNPVVVDVTALYEQCKGEARQYVSNQKSICGNSARATGTGGSACLDSKFDEMLGRMLGDCYTKYGK